MEMFRKTPELAEMLSPFLNAQKTVSFAQSGLLLTSRSWKGGQVIWNRLIKRSLPSDENLLELEWLQQKEFISSKKTQILFPLFKS